jgi:hypothetical protein
MTTLADWHKAFADAATWAHPIVLTKFVWNDDVNLLSSFSFIRRGLVASVFNTRFVDSVVVKSTLYEFAVDTVSIVRLRDGRLKSRVILPPALVLQLIAETLELHGLYV